MHTFWHAIPTSLLIFNVSVFLSEIHLKAVFSNTQHFAVYVCCMPSHRLQWLDAHLVGAKNGSTGKNGTENLNWRLGIGRVGRVVSCGHTLFRKRGKGSGNFFRYSRFLYRNFIYLQCASAKAAEAAACGFTVDLHLVIVVINSTHVTEYCAVIGPTLHRAQRNRLLYCGFTENCVLNALYETAHALTGVISLCMFEC